MAASVRGGVALTTAEAARLLSVSVSTIQTMVSTGVLQATRTAGGHRRVALESIEACVRARAREALSAVSTLAGQRSLLCMLVVGSAIAPTHEGLSVAVGGPGVACHRAADVFDALIQAARLSPDLLITDHVLDSIDGLELVRRLRRHPEFAAMIAVVLISDNRSTALSGAPGPPGTLIIRGPPCIDRLRGLVDALRLNRARAGSATDRHRTQFGDGQ
ncbi:MAG: hypothetical protein RL322_325 [Pseudomonadota bacterium]